ncbi:MAG: ATP-dependent helicase [Sandaracinaceae bacterium]|nr:ATP-dependent helicase [Sandaracinaceae bacterium]
MAPYEPTTEQRRVIAHDGNAFVRACPGAGKTRTIVERARVLISAEHDRRGAVFLSFTNTAIRELEERLRSYGIFPTPLFPHFIGTFDSFVWKFLIAPFGLDGCDAAPTLIPDKGAWEVKPFEAAQSLRLDFFSRDTGRLIPGLATRVGFAPKNGPGAWEARARTMLANAHAAGRVDFDDVRAFVQGRLADVGFAKRVGAALRGRFKEIIVDEAQDCSPADLRVVDWLRKSGIAVKIICDPNQAIYSFRGGLTDELLEFGMGFSVGDQLHIRGNFRSSPAICSAISFLRPPGARGTPDVALGRYNAETTPVHILAYAGTGVPSSIGDAFHKLARGLGICTGDAPVVAATLASAAKAVGNPVIIPGDDRTLLLADSAVGYHLADEAGRRREALTGLHRAILLVQGCIGSVSDYSKYVLDEGLQDGRWRADAISIGELLRVRPNEPADKWLKRAREALESGIVGAKTISQRLRTNKDLQAVLARADQTPLPARTIHGVKGLEFPAICVVLTTKTAKGILDVLEGESTVAEEDARKIYVGASRAERLLAIATPKSQAERLRAHLSKGTTPVRLVTL